ncbi:DNA polymerase I [Pedobacter sp. SYSU D00535]|uniref:DNA polymerase I n=1 Tax=Pedobacter sp. SYSU D00535 TaxID=2810308 RepID=UPI001A960843|nr:DNA polymerase I [Pedobacter sp. SYSU D00535]
MKKKRLFLLDVMPLLYRAHFATMGKRFGTSTGIDTRTSLVFFNYIFQILLEEKPDALAAALDSKSKDRLDLSDDYKANREKMPSEIAEAFPYALRLLEYLQIPVLKVDGLEADDILASLALRSQKENYSVYIVSPDKDFAQLVNENVFLFRPAYKGAVMETLDTEGVRGKFGVDPSQITDFLALRGDSADNIAGIKGIGDKTAASLLAQFKNIEHIIEEAEKIRQPKIRESILESQEQLMQNKQLVSLADKLPFEVEPASLIRKPAMEPELLQLLEELEFVRIKERILKAGLIKQESASAASSSRIALKMEKASLEDCIESISKAKQIALAFQPDVSKSIFFHFDAKEAVELQIADRMQWRELLTELDKSEAEVYGWFLKPLLKKIMTMDLQPPGKWKDLSLAAYLLAPDAKIEWEYLKEKYQLSEYELLGPYQQLSYLPALSQLAEKIEQELDRLDLRPLYENIELPLQKVIAGMEISGIRIDEPALAEIEELLSVQLQELEKEIFELAGSRFNLGSPSQTATVLRTIVEASELKKTKTGQISTAEPFLIDLAPKYPFVAKLLEHRKLSKIINTYVQALPRYVNPETNKIHPNFQQIVAGTGRLSCTEPNLQNLPVKSEAGREVRRAIIPSGEERSILSIDYNQIELRLLATLSEDEFLVEAFRADKDIHTITACRIFKVEESAVNKNMRNKAKSVNFGIAYGMTPWGLASRLKISQREAKEIIDAYFEEFSSVKSYLERSIEESRERGFSRTRYGRIRYIEGIDSRNGTTRKMAERIAVNAPLQGLAADIIKEAMVKVDEYISRKALKTRLILQVHDELVFDAVDAELPDIVPAIQSIMENTAKFIVPLKVGITAGKNWLEQEPYKL